MQGVLGKEHHANVSRAVFLGAVLLRTCAEITKACTMVEAVSPCRECRAAGARRITSSPWARATSKLRRCGIPRPRRAATGASAPPFHKHCLRHGAWDLLALPTCSCAVSLTVHLGFRATVQGVMPFFPPVVRFVAKLPF